MGTPYDPKQVQQAADDAAKKVEQAIEAARPTYDLAAVHHGHTLLFLSMIEALTTKAVLTPKEITDAIDRVRGYLGDDFCKGYPDHMANIVKADLG